MEGIDGSRMNEWICQIHHTKFAAQDLKGRIVECPYCLRDQMNVLRDKLNTVEGHRDALLRAIEIKQTVEPARV